MPVDKERYNEYHREYAKRNIEKHREVCRRYRQYSMKPETKNKIREYQRLYYLARKSGSSIEELRNV